jgi:ligand-binding sensor domain-containing protein/signal transduction histidine kinase
MPPRRARRALPLLALLLGLVPSTAHGQGLPLRCYGVREGLAHSRVTAILQDAAGYLWIGTWEGASRFDGYGFAEFGRQEGLAAPIVSAVAQDPRGDLWFASRGEGLIRLPGRPDEAAPRTGSPERFDLSSPTRLPGAGRVDALVFSTRGVLWAVTEAGIFRGVPGAHGRPHFTLVLRRDPADVPWRGALRDPAGRVWLGAGSELVEGTDRGLVRHGRPPGGRSGIVALAEGSGGRILAATASALFELTPPAPGRDGRNGGSWRPIPLELGSARPVETLSHGPGDALWIGTRHGLVRWAQGRRELFSTAQRLPDDEILALAPDRDGNLWIGTAAAGICRLSPESLRSFNWQEGLPDPDVRKVVEDRAGRVYASTAQGGIVSVAGDAISPVPGTRTPPFDTIGRRILQDRTGDWWLGTDEGIYRIRGPALELSRAERLGGDDGLPDDAVAAFPGLFEDPGGALWIALRDGRVFRRPRRPAGASLFDERFDPVPPEEVPAGLQALAADRTGGLWLAGAGGLVRRAPDGSSSRLAPGPGLPETRARSLFADARGRLWIALAARGLSRTDDPGAAAPAFSHLSTADGLASDVVGAVCADRFGRLYLGSGRGLDRLDPASGRLRHFTLEDGLAGDFVNDLLCDRRGDVWVATATGLSRLSPDPPHPPPPPPPVYLTRVRIAGDELPLPATGVRRLAGLTLPASRNQVELDFVGLSFAGDAPPRYQYRLDGARGSWSLPSERRTVDYAHLEPGTYRFLVRAVNPDGVASREPAELSFNVLPPFWRRGWFLALMAATVAAAGFWLHRVRQERAVALERIRRQIATDLHDDIGAGLSQIAILSEVTRRAPAAETGRGLGEIAELARGLRESMADIVWAVDPRRDWLANLVSRMRQVAFDLLEGEGMRVDFQAPDEELIEHVGLGPDQRRHILLLFKEAVHNIVRHARASRAVLRVELADGHLLLTIEDDGRGFDPAGRFEGHGLADMQHRAEALGGTLEILSTPGRTRLSLAVPIRRRAFPRPFMRLPWPGRARTVGPGEK